MIDQLKDIKIILLGHIQSEIALQTANDNDVSNFEYLITMIDQSLLENDTNQRKKVFEDEIKAIDKKFYDSLIKSLKEMQRIPPIDQKNINNFISYCDDLRSLVDTNDVSKGPNVISEIFDETDVNKTDFIGGDTSGLVNEKISKRILEYYQNELNELKKLLAINLIIVSRLEREGKPTDNILKRVDKITGMKKYYEDTIEYIKSSPISEILYLDQWDKKNPEKVTKFTKKALSKSKNINLIQRELRKLKYEEMYQLGVASYKARNSFFQKAKINHVQNKIVNLRKKQGQIIIKQRYLVIKKAKSFIASLIKERKKLQLITKEHMAYEEKMLALKEAKQRQKEEKARTHQTIEQLMTSFHSDLATEQQKTYEKILGGVGRLRRKLGKLSSTIQENLSQQPEIFNSTSTVQEEPNIVFDEDQKETIDELGIPELSEEEISTIDSYKQELLAEANSEPNVTEPVSNFDINLGVLDEKPKAYTPVPEFVDHDKTEEADQKLNNRLQTFSHAIIKGWHAFRRELKNNNDDNKLSM